MIRRPPRSTLDRSSAASDVYKRQRYDAGGVTPVTSAVINWVISYTIPLSTAVAFCSCVWAIFTVLRMFVRSRLAASYLSAHSFIVSGAIAGATAVDSGGG